jgi:hypothetical protein
VGGSLKGNHGRGQDIVAGAGVTRSQGPSLAAMNGEQLQLATVAFIVWCCCMGLSVAARTPGHACIHTLDALLGGDQSAR